MLRLLLLIAIISIAAGPASAGRRVALVIGNNLYRNLAAGQQLRNAVGDARAMVATLGDLGFEVLAGENLDRSELIGKLSDFAARLSSDDIAFFYYAGHGVAINGQNYLLPSDIPAPRATGRDEEERLADLAVPESRIIDRIKAAGARVAVVVLDSCRDNPLAASTGRSVGTGRGLVRPPETRGLLSIYSAGIGQQALDRLNEKDPNPNSVFTRVFMKKLRQPGLGLRAAAFETQGDVANLAAESGQDQVPGVYSQIIGPDIFLDGPVAALSAGVAPQRHSEAPLAASSDSLADQTAKRQGLAAVDSSKADRPPEVAGPGKQPTPFGSAQTAGVSMPDAAQAVRPLVPSEGAPVTKVEPPTPVSERSRLSSLGMSLTPAVGVVGAGRDGVVVADIEPEGAGAKKGFRTGDLILEASGKPVSLPADVAGALAAARTAHRKAVLLRVKTDDTIRFVAVPAQATLGMSFAVLSDQVRKRFGIVSRVNGVAVTAVDAGSSAEQHTLKTGDVIVEVDQKTMSDPVDVDVEIETLRSAGKKSALLLVSNGQGEVRYVALGVE